MHRRGMPLLVMGAYLSSLALPAVAIPAAYSSQYHLHGELRLPYAGLIETFEVWTNGSEQRIDWYDGLDV